MQKFKLSLALALIAVFLGSAPVEAQSTSQQLQCKNGPATRTYGGANWLVFSCDDGLSLAFVAVPGSPASPAYFMIRPQDDGRYHLVGKSNGDVAASNAAVKEIQNLSKSDVDALIAATKSGKP